VADTGPGIEPATLAKIFEPLFTTKAFGVGLGLPTVRRIVQQHGGSIEAVSEPGRGTTFLVRIPQIVQPEERAA
jgi:signal transduction histidine kinase